MADQSPPPPGLEVEDVEGHLKYSGKYKVAAAKTGKRVGQHFRVLRNIVDEKGNILRSFYYCTSCKGVIQHDSQIGTAPLNRHIRQCEANKDDDDDDQAGDDQADDDQGDDDEEIDSQEDDDPSQSSEIGDFDDQQTKSSKKSVSLETSGPKKVVKKRGKGGQSKVVEEQKPMNARGNDLF